MSIPNEAGILRAGVDQNTDALKGLDASFLKENPDFVDAYRQIRWDDINTLNKLIAMTEQLVVKYKDPNDTIKQSIEIIFYQILQRYPLFFGYWKKFTAIEYQLYGLEKSIATLAKSVEAFPTSLELWCDYLNVLLTNNPDEVDLIRSNFLVARTLVGYHFLSHPFWDKYIEFESKQEQWDKVNEIYQELITIPLHQYAKYCTAYKNFLHGPNATNAFKDPQLEVKFKKTYDLVNKLWVYESRIRQNFFNLTPLSAEEIQNWEQYLNFIIENQSILGLKTELIKYIFERCLIPCLYIEKFWLLYTQWMKTQVNMKEEKENESFFTLQDVIYLYQRGAKMLPVQLKEYRIDYIVYLKTIYRKEKEYVFVIFTEAIFELIQMWPHEPRLMTEYLILLKRHDFPSSIEQTSQEILGQQTSFASFLDSTIKNFLSNKPKKENPIDDMINQSNFSIVVVELIKVIWLVLKNIIQTRKYFNYFSKLPALKSSTTFWSTYYKFEKSTKNFAKLNKFITNLGKEITLPTATINDILTDYQSFYLINSNLNDYQTSDTSANSNDITIDPLLQSQFKINDPQWIPEKHHTTLRSEWYKTKQYRENGHVGIIFDRPYIVNQILDRDSKSFKNVPPPSPICKNLEKINHIGKSKDIFTEEYLNKLYN
ncbi:Prp39p NDAI_0G00220 [Naumovozyma dairenensis CBS 421]|uniref:Suppressor of forked domain-containing protein n=1 Tax=Naumovozyma dairenensis (strain ATCC 10597 / BCRC 20456 / CBS 421 / NBRC 0211 / NRRL Y-12639) TaxID=1071378 RepID=G0WDD7_NAUDC|nr:hypothetical protein NDAI_0G00220 [Naumovozyma dairenensis CBS 421]CCD25798.2 hypothetical protein NDAI_0G00220 [Naumovozyma dairenensis CBS 421]